MKKQIKIIDIILFIIAVTLTITNLVMYKNILAKQKNNNINTEIVQEEEENSSDEELSDEFEIKNLKSMSERDRMEHYFAEYADYIESGNYEKAYNLLYPDFKNKYFPTLEKFVQYIKNTYPESMAFSYNNIDRQGTIYVLDIDILDVKNKQNKKSHRVVIEEFDFDDFVLSFQVI